MPDIPPWILHSTEKSSGPRECSWWSRLLCGAPHRERVPTARLEEPSSHRHYSISTATRKTLQLGLLSYHVWLYLLSHLSHCFRHMSDTRFRVHLKRRVDVSTSTHQTLLQLSRAKIDPCTTPTLKVKTSRTHPEASSSTEIDENGRSHVVTTS